MWTDTTRRQFARSDLRLPSDLTDAEWAVLEPLFPARSRRGRPPLWSYRQIVEALLYLLRGGLPWRMLPPDLFPPMTTVQHTSTAGATSGCGARSTTRCSWRRARRWVAKQRRRPE